MKYMLFVPGFLTAQTCSSRGDTYFDVYTYAIAHGFEFMYMPIPNNNYGDLGNTTMEDCLDNVLGQYNTICHTTIGPTDTIMFVGHSMGGMIISRLVTSAYSDKLKRRPDSVRLLNPAIGKHLSWAEVITGTLLSFVPKLTGLAIVPVPIADRETLYPASLPLSPGCKLLLGTSLLQTMGKLLVNNRQWVLQPDDGMCEIRIVQCRGDRVVSYPDTRAHAKAYSHSIQFVTIASDYHEYFDADILDTLFGGR